MTEKDIQRQVERFLDAETTLDEERMLYEFFAREDVPAALLQYRDMFRALASVNGIDAAFGNVTEDLSRSPKAMRLHPRMLWWKYASAAAMIAVVFTTGLLFLHHRRSSDYAIAYIQGKRIEGHDLAMKMSKEALCEIFSNGDNIDNSLKDIFNPE